MTEPAVSLVPEAFERQHKPGPRRRRSLKGGMPRRHQDARVQAARRYRTLYEQIIEAHPPKHRLGRTLSAMLADLLMDYGGLRQSKRKGARAARRKTTGLIMGMLREVRNISSPHGESEDLARLLATEREP